jgi:hypothetical protein
VRREEGSECTADGHCGKGLSVPFQREQRGREATGNEDERAENEVLSFGSHMDVDGGLDDRRAVILPYMRSGIGIPSRSSAPTIVFRNTSAQTARRCRSASSFSLRIGYLW